MNQNKIHNNLIEQSENDKALGLILSIRKTLDDLYILKTKIKKVLNE